MEITCSAIIWLLCIGGHPGEVEISLSDHGFGIYATVQAEGWQASSSSGGDVAPPPFNQDRLSRACVDSFCIGYHRHCDDGEHPTDCSYIFDADGPLHHRVVITSDDEAGVRTAMQHIGIVIDASAHRGVALSLFEDESPHRSPEEIFCLQPTDPQSVEAGC